MPSYHHQIRKRGARNFELASRTLQSPQPHRRLPDFLSLDDFILGPDSMQEPRMVGGHLEGSRNVAIKNTNEWRIRVPSLRESAYGGFTRN